MSYRIDFAAAMSIRPSGQMLVSGHEDVCSAFMDTSLASITGRVRLFPAWWTSRLTDLAPWRPSWVSATTRVRPLPSAQFGVFLRWVRHDRPPPRLLRLMWRVASAPCAFAPWTVYALQSPESCPCVDLLRCYVAARSRHCRTASARLCTALLSFRYVHILCPVRRKARSKRGCVSPRPSCRRSASAGVPRVRARRSRQPIISSPSTR